MRHFLNVFFSTHFIQSITFCIKQSIKHVLAQSYIFYFIIFYFFFNKFNIFSLPAPVVISMTNCVSLGFGDTITWDELYGAILCLLGCFLHVIKQIAIYFSCLADCCNSVSPRSSGNVSRTTNLLLIVILGELLLSEHEFERKSK